MINWMGLKQILTEKDSRSIFDIRGDADLGPYTNVICSCRLDIYYTIMHVTKTKIHGHKCVIALKLIVFVFGKRLSKT